MKEFEFGGKWSGLLMTLLLPLVAILLNILAEFESIYSGEALFLISERFQEIKLLSAFSMAGYAVYFLLLVALWRLVPGRWTQGVELETGERLLYKLNGLYCLINLLNLGFRSFLVLFVGIIVSCFSRLGKELFSLVLDHYYEHLVASMIASFAISIGVYIQSHLSHSTLLARGGNTGKFTYDFFIGRILNPRFGLFDLKYFCELRPGLYLWVLLDISYVCDAIIQIAQLSVQQTKIIAITTPLLVVCFLHTWYVVDSLFNEKAVLSTMDITTDGFGFMLAFGDLCWVPFLYTLQARYLYYKYITIVHFASTAVSSSVAMEIIDRAITDNKTIVASILLYLVGYYIFRMANLQKDKFRSNRLVKVKFIETENGQRLLTSGWWGKARHINYFGDWLMSCSFSTLCGFRSPIPFFYPIYMAILLIHRESRDESKCRRKYGTAYDKYCKVVRYKIIPYIY